MGTAFCQLAGMKPHTCRNESATHTRNQIDALQRGPTAMAGGHFMFIPFQTDQTIIECFQDERRRMLGYGTE